MLDGCEDGSVALKAYISCCCAGTGMPLYDPESGALAFMPDSGELASDRTSCEPCPP
jgi:hypothetical protein